MGLLILIVVGSVLGWLASIVLRIEDSRGILVNAAVGVAGALVAGFLAGNGLFLGALTGSALVWAVAGAVVALVGLGLVKRRAFR